jgi:hypothetical protein
VSRIQLALGRRRGRREIGGEACRAGWRNRRCRVRSYELRGESSVWPPSMHSARSLEHLRIGVFSRNPLKPIYERRQLIPQTVHLKLLNMLCKAMAEQDRAKAAELHRDLFQSGMDRILVVSSHALQSPLPTFAIIPFSPEFYAALLQCPECPIQLHTGS